jgi:acyl-CoA thioester hydrolase
MELATETRIRVRYAETDNMGVVYYSNYLVWMEVGRVELCRALGFEYREMEREDGILLAVAEANCRYLAPARFDDQVIVRTWVEKANRRMAMFSYEMRLANARANGDGEPAVKLATGYTKHLFLTRDMHPISLPEKYWAMFGLTATAPAK